MFWISHEVIKKIGKNTNFVVQKSVVTKMLISTYEQKYVLITKLSK